MAGTRQLAAILISEIDGFATLIQQDEEKAAELKNRYREVLGLVVPGFNGMIHQSIGPESLSIFPSAVEAVRCAIELQNAFQEGIYVPVKIGIHLGDIILTDEEAIGDSLEVARKIASQSEAGGILVSNKIYEEVKSQDGIETAYAKTCELKERGMQVKLYAITNKGIRVPEGLPANGYTERESVGTGSGLRFFWEEAKRRNVVRVVSIYAAAAYVFLEISSIVSDSLNMPDWTMVVIIAALSVIFVVLTIISWIYDITPEGIKKTVPVHELKEVRTEATVRSNGNWFTRNKILRRYLVPLVVIALLVGFYFFKDRIFQNWERVNKVALEHTERANLFIKNHADPALIKAELDLALEADSEYSRALYLYALIHLMDGDTALTKQKLHAAVESDPGYAHAWNILAVLAFRQDSFELAMRYGFTALDADPDNTFAAFTMAIQCEERGLDRQAEELYLQAIDRDSLFTEAISNLGALYNKMNRPIDAIRILRKSLKLSPASQDNFRIYKNLAEAHFILKEYDQTWACLLESKTLNPDFAETEKCFARYYEAKDDPEASILHWRRYLALETDSFEVQKAELHLDSIRTLLLE
jgi:class 3 adenylate cyclase/tetratricopeptide (TPR) repeat protein